MFKLPIIIDNFPNHHTIKKMFLEHVEHSEYDPIKDDFQNISRSDWPDREWNAAYSELMIPLISKAVEPHFTKMKYTSFANGPIWFQQYNTNDHHGWHRHGRTDWGFVYYVELPPDGPPTEFRNPLDENEIYSPNVVEGQFILFPALLEHRSNTNLSSGRKTVIVLNYMTE